jgi:hypothetical protein
MKVKSEAPVAMLKTFKEFGLPEAMVTDRAPELIEGQWGRNSRHTMSPPELPNQRHRGRIELKLVFENIKRQRGDT